MKGKLILKIFGIITITIIAITGYVTQYVKVTSENIANNVLRLHVVANSDEDYDQELKLAVRDGIVKLANEITKDAKSAKETKAIMSDNIKKFEKISDKIIREKGYTYNVTATVDKSMFPTKSYGDITFPAGEYNALKVVIGKGEGKNWWCVLYPQLCVNNNSQDNEPSDNSYAKLSEESKNRLKNVLTNEEYEIISKREGKSTKVKFKLLEVFANIK